MSERWDQHFLQLAIDHARMSKDPSTHVGAVIVGPDREIRSMGFNGFPRGIRDTPERLNDREAKLRIIVHAETNAILNAARVGIPTKGCTLYLAATDKTGAIWGGAPCTRCTVEVIQAGIVEVVTRPFKDVPSRWSGDIAFAEALLKEAGVSYREIAALSNEGKSL
jgi:dCMP deaminase